MGILRFDKQGQAALGVRIGEEVVDLSTAAPHLPTDLADLLRAGPSAVLAAKAAAASARERLPVAGLRLLPPAMSSRKVICLGLNYVDHAAEGGMSKPDYPVVFFRSASSFVAHGDALVRPVCSDMFDYEGELVAFVGQRARHVPADRALSVIAGYSVFNDGSVRDYQRKTAQWTIGKNFDGSGGFGPEFVAAADLPPGARGLRLQTRLNGKVMQDANTSDMVFDVATTVAILSECMTLEPGDLLVMGTPAGVGAARTPPVFLKPGDVCEVEIESVGLLRNPVVQEQPS